LVENLILFKTFYYPISAELYFQSGGIFLLKIMRHSISVKKRFEVFKRDNFTCQYCSAKPPLIPLEVDHIYPVCKGGDNSIENLITSCFDCNRGKGSGVLENIPDTLVVKFERMKLAKMQYNQYKKILKNQKNIIDAEIEQVELVYSSCFKGWSLSAKFKISIKQFIQKLGVEDVVDSMEKACNRIENQSAVPKYFCGICWNKIKNNE
jgi:hypothetical protein